MTSHGGWWHRSATTRVPGWWSWTCNCRTRRMAVADTMGLFLPARAADVQVGAYLIDGELVARSAEIAGRHVAFPSGEWLAGAR